jgi:hypothetical protein
MSQRAAQPIIYGLRGRPALRTVQQRAKAPHLDVDATPGEFEIDALDDPGGLQTQPAGEQRLDFLSRDPTRKFNVTRLVGLWITRPTACPQAHRARPSASNMNAGFRMKR